MNAIKLFLTASAIIVYQSIYGQYCTPTFPTFGNCGTVMSFTTTGADVNLNYVSNKAGYKPNSVVGNRIEATPNQTLTLNLYITTFWAFAHLYADVNGDGVFEPSEMIGKFGDLVNRTYHNEATGVQCKIDGAVPTYTVPLVADGTILRLRVINGNTSVDGAEPNPCSGWREGSYMDFELLVKNPVFEKITMNSSTGGTYTILNNAGELIPSETMVSVGSKLTVQASPDEGYQVKEIKVNNTPIEGNQFTFAGESKIEVTFTNDIFLSHNTPENYALTIQDNDNNVLTNGATFARGKDLILTFEPSVGYQISTLSINGEDQFPLLQNNVLTLSNCQANVTIVATATKKRFPVYYNTPTSGTGSLSVRNETASANVKSGDLIEYGSNLTIFSKASIISSLVSLNVNGVDRKSELVLDKLSIQLTDTISIQANFVATQYTLSFARKGNGNGTIRAINTNDSDKEVVTGSDVVKSHYLYLEMTPNAGSTITQIKMNDSIVDLSDENYELEKKEDHWILWFEMSQDLSFEVTFTDPNSITDVSTNFSIMYHAESATLKIPNGATAMIIDSSGRTIRTLNGPTCSLQSLSNGVYLVKITTKEIQKTIKITKR